MKQRHLLFLSCSCLALIYACTPPAPREPVKQWAPHGFSWARPDSQPHDTGLVRVTGYVRLPLEMTTEEDRGSLELWERRNQRTGVDLHLNIGMGDAPNQQKPLPEQYADSSLFITGASGEVIRSQERVEVLARWMGPQSDVLEVVRISKAAIQLPEPDSVYNFAIDRKNIKSGEAEGRLVFAEGNLTVPSIVLMDRDIDLELNRKNLRVAARVLMGDGPSQMKPAKTIAGKGQLLDMGGNPMPSGSVKVYGVFHDGRIYVEEIAPVASPAPPLKDKNTAGGKMLPVIDKKQ